ncbi:MAG TPA: hypothetical protein VFZ61_02460 [Polyangiales bacterium]
MRALRSLVPILLHKLVPLLLLLVGVVTARHARAEQPACVEVVLPESLPEQQTWRSLLLQETKALLAGEAGECASVELSAEQDGSLLMLQVSWAGSARTQPLALAELGAAERARATALLARGMLQQVIEQRQRESLEGPSASSVVGASATPAAPTADDPRGEEQAEDAAKVTRQPATNATQLTPPQLPNTSKRRRRSRWDDYNWAWQPDEAARIAAARKDRFMGPDRMRRGSPWSGFASSGSTIGLNTSNAYVLLELGVLHVVNARWARFGAALLGMFSPTRASTGGPGLRGSLEFRMANRPRARVWLGPGLSIVELVVNGDSAADGSNFRVARPVSTLDGRATIDIAINGQAYMYIAAEFSYVMRFLKVKNMETVLFTFAGPMLGVHVGVAF